LKFIIQKYEHNASGTRICVIIKINTTVSSSKSVVVSSFSVVNFKTVSLRIEEQTIRLKSWKPGEITFDGLPGGHYETHRTWDWSVGETLTDVYAIGVPKFHTTGIKLRYG